MGLIIYSEFERLVVILLTFNGQEYVSWESIGEV
jgi:hypothetical protein